MSVSGQCYFSAMLDPQRNRGQCAQPCRLPFSVEGGTGGYDLSLKDYSIVSRLKELEAAGVASAKIEGRMKRPEYVAAATAVCRYAADGKEIPEELAQKLEAVFSPMEFTDGYLTGELGRGMFGIRQKEDVEAATSDVLKELRQLYKDEKQTIPLDFRVEISQRKARPSHGDSEGQRHGRRWRPQGETLAVTEARCLEQLQTGGGTPFFCRRLDAHIDPGLSLPVSELNQMRRAVVESLEKQRGQRRPAPFSTVAPPKGENHQASKKQKLRVWFEHDRVPDCMKGCDLVYVPLSTPAPAAGGAFEPGGKSGGPHAPGHVRPGGCGPPPACPSGGDRREPRVGGQFGGAGPCPGNGYVYPRRVQPEYFQHSLRRMV